jgi:hypothetical protein
MREVALYEQTEVDAGGVCDARPQPDHGKYRGQDHESLFHALVPPPVGADLAPRENLVLLGVQTVNDRGGKG